MKVHGEGGAIASSAPAAFEYRSATHAFPSSGLVRPRRVLRRLLLLLALLRLRLPLPQLGLLVDVPESPPVQVAAGVKVSRHDTLGAGGTQHGTESALATRKPEQRVHAHVHLRERHGIASEVPRPALQAQQRGAREADPVGRPLAERPHRLHAGLLSMKEVRRAAVDDLE